MNDPKKATGTSSSSNALVKSILCVALIIVGVLYRNFHHNPAQAEPMLIIGKGTSYEKEWKRVDSLADKGLYQSALDLTNQIYTKAKGENNNAQVVKALLHRYLFSEKFQENSREYEIYDLQNELKTAKFPLAQMLHSMLGDLYWQYYQLHRWEFAQRSQTVNFDNDSINTWDLTHLVDMAMKEFRASIVPADSLQRTNEDIYSDIIIDGDADKKLRPTLYDFLAFRAADFFSNQEAAISRPADHFIIEDPAYFGSAEKFAALTLSSKDTLSMDYDALKTYQSLVKFHLKDDDPDALVDADMQRIVFVHNNAVMPESDSLYEIALRQLAANYPDSPVTADVFYLLALYHNGLANKYVAGKEETYRWENKRALEICNAVIKKFPLTTGGNNCNALRLQILTKNISFRNDNTVIPDEASRSLLSFRNVDHLWFRVVTVKDEFVDSYDYRTQEEIIKDYLKKPVYASWEETIPNDSDYQTHSAEIKIPALPSGAYVILASADKDFSMDKNGIAYNEIWSSEISYIHRQNDKGGYEYFFLDRKTGAPLENAAVQVWQQRYDYTDRGYHYKRAEKLTSDKDGKVSIAPAENYRTMFLEVNWGTYHLYTNSQYQYKSYYEAPKMNEKTFFFTDRAIYRPGQTIYFKGIVIETDGTNNRILKSHSSTVTLFDVNYQKVASLDLETNDYGSFSGTFTAPSAGLTGQMHIQNESGTNYFSVEEYKRPKFEVNMEPLQGAYKLNDSLKVKGKATMFAGSNVDGATVKYRVVRSASFPYWYYYWRGYYPQSALVEITNGETTSNDTGGFVIPFKALPDKAVPAESSPTFTYTVYADVTDITGETHSTTTYVYVGYVALNLNLGISSLVDKNEKDSVNVALTNLSGQEDSGMVTYTITKLNDPDHIILDRGWSMPDEFIYSQADWNKWFPEAPYKNENDMTTWTKGKQIVSSTFKAGKNTYMKWSKSSWDPGVYVVEAHAKDKYGNDVKDVKYFTLFDTKEKTPATKEVFSYQAITTDVQPGGKAKFLIGTAAENVQVLYEIEQDQNILSKEWLKLSNEQRYIEIPIEEKYRGNISVHFAFVYHNHAYTRDQTIYVPWESKDLDITFETFRDKLQPGSKEEWKMKVKGPKGEKVAAEMVAAMYDASLDEFRANYWSFGIYQSYYNSYYWQNGVESVTTSGIYYDDDWNPYASYDYRDYDHLNWFGFSYSYAYYGYGWNWDFGDGEYDGIVTKSTIDEDVPMEHSRAVLKKDKVNAAYDVTATNANACVATGSTTTLAGNNNGPVFAPDQTEVSGQDNQDYRGFIGGKNKDVAASLKDVKARENLNETVFFYPQLETDSAGAVIIKFTMNEALTKWKFTAFAHTKDLKYGQVAKEVVTQKDLMVMPVPPRFFREKDHFTFTAKVSNLSAKDLDGNAQLQLFDATTMKPIDAQVLTTAATLPFSVKKGMSAPLSWDLYIPVGCGPIQYKIVASAGDFSDGETDAIPVLSNRMLVTETMPLPIRGGQTKEYHFDKLMSMSNGSSTLTNQRLTLEFTANPAWYAVQALPYMIEYPYECSEQTFERYYANSIASTIANSSPKIKAVFDTWKTKSPDAFLSNLEKNQELKNLILTETPWVLESQDESERKRRVALLFDVNTMSNDLDKALTKLEKMQVSNGGWPWFDDMPDDRYITQYIITGMGHLDHLGVKTVREDSRCWNMVQKGVGYLDKRIREDYDWILKYDKAHMDDDHLSYEQIQYLYARSYFKDVNMSARDKTAFDYFMGQAKKYWLGKGNYMEAMIALSTFRYDDKTTSTDIMKSLTETALHSDEMGMYYKDNTGGYYWYQAPIETQSLIIEAFKDVSNDQKSVDDLRVWLLKNKQTNDWKTTTATAEACYALLMDGTQWLATESDVSITVGDQVIDPKKMGLAEEAGTGYFKTAWTADQIKPDMGKVTVTKAGAGVSWGAMYWQYFEDLDQITPAATPLSVSKKLFKVVNTSSGPVITPIDDKTVLKPGDKIKVRVELRNDRDMQYIHMKDMRASGFEPINVISQYKYQDGLGYYESTKDASTDFFFSFLPKGTHVFEYQLNVVNAGDFSNGLTEVQCMYAPEFSCHSEGSRVVVSKP